MMKDAMKAKNIPVDCHNGSFREVKSVVGQQASVDVDPVSQHEVEDDSGSQQTSEAAGTGAQQVDSGA